MSISIEKPNIDTDAEAMINLSIQAFPFQLQSVEALRYAVAQHGDETERLSIVAKKDGKVVARAVAGPPEEMANTETGMAGIIVDRDHRGQGIGGAMFGRVMQHLSQFSFNAITAHVTSDAGIRFAKQRGFATTRTARISHLKLAEAATAPPAPEGIRFRGFTQIDDPHVIFDIEAAVISDVPADTPILILPYKEWKAQFYDNPRNDMDSSLVAFDGDTPVGLTWQDRVGERIWTGMTGTLRSHRGRGIAKAMKAASLARAYHSGATVAYTDNDADNAAMLAVNHWLGYRPYTDQHTMVRRLA